MSSDHHDHLPVGNLDRRDFLLRLGLGAVGVEAYAGTSHAGQPAAPAAKITPDQHELQERGTRNRLTSQRKGVGISPSGGRKALTRVLPQL